MNNFKYAYAPHCDMWDGMAKTEKRGDNGLHKLASQMFPNVKDGGNSKKTREIMAGEWDTISNAVIKTASGDTARIGFIRNKKRKGYDIYFISESSEISLQTKRNAAFAVYVAENEVTTGGMAIGNVYVLSVNKDYVKDGEVKAIDFFDVIDITDEAMELALTVEKEIKKIPKLSSCSEFSDKCSKCPYFSTVCKEKFQKDYEILNLMRMSTSKKALLVEKGCRTYSDVLPHLTKNTTIYKQAQAHISGNEYTIFEPEKIAEWIDNLKYPLYFLDFETIQNVVPEYDGCKPFDQIPFQFSLHIQRRPGAVLEHKEFLGNPNEDFQSELAAMLADSIGSEGSIIAYNASFEKSRIKEMADRYAAEKSPVCLYIADTFRDMIERFADLMDPFSKMWVYYLHQNGSFSIKHVLPSMFPCDPELDYSELSQVHNGTEAMDMFRQMKDMGAAEYAKARTNMLEYCKLDTYAMVKILGKLKEIISAV